MRHRRKTVKLQRDKEHRLSMIRNQVISLLRHGKIQTTLEKAKESRRWVEKMITLGKKGDLHSRRLARRFLGSREMTNYLFDKIAPLFSDRNSGYTRIYRIGTRRGDGADLAILELIKRPEG